MNADRERSWRQWARWSGLILVVAACGLMVYRHDIALSQFFLEARDWPGDFRRAIAMSEFFAHGFGVTVCLILIVALARDKAVYVPRLAASAFLAGGMANLIKLAIARRRPNFTQNEITDISDTWGSASGLFQENGLPEVWDYSWQSFPSAHTATAVGLAIGLSFLFPRARFLFWGMALLGGIQRIVFDAHWPSDVMAGLVLGLISGVCCTVPGAIGSAGFDRLENWLLRITRQRKRSHQQPLASISDRTAA